MREVIAIYHNHLDPQWARAYNRPVHFHGVTQRSYAELWEWIMGEWLALADRGLTFNEGQAIVLRTFMERSLEEKGRIKELVAKNICAMPLQGELTPESNYSPAEGLARNYLIARPLYDELAGRDHPSLKVAWLYDAFGNGPNHPQILKLAGAEAVGGTKYRQCQEDYWVGIDGTVLPCIDKKLCNYYYVWSKHPPCSTCRGDGCAACEGRGMTAGLRFDKGDAMVALERAAAGQEQTAFVFVGGEEALPDAALVEAVEEMNRRYEGEVSFRFGLFSDFWACHQQAYIRGAAAYDGPVIDLNPVHAGCYVTRIKTKQETYAAVYALLRAEAVEANAAWDRGIAEKPSADFTQAWRDLVLCIHHDSISGAHIDSGYEELAELRRSAMITAARHGAPVVPPDTAKRGFREVNGKRTKMLGGIEVVFDREGIFSACVGEINPFGSFKYRKMTYAQNDSGQVHIGELMMRADWGDNHNSYVWGEMQLLGAKNYAVFESADAIWWRGAYRVGDPNVAKLKWEIVVRASEDGKRLDFTTEIDWDTRNKRILVNVPVDSRDKSAVWEVPYGFITRVFDPEDMEGFDIRDMDAKIKTRPIGDYPALHWTNRSTANGGVALLTKGLPCVKWRPGCFELSLLRSPEISGDTVKPSITELWDVDGTRDAGRHCFEYSIWPYGGALPYGDLTRAGYLYNGCTFPLPFSLEGDVVVTSFKLAEDGNGFILRCQEAGGRNGQLGIQLMEARAVVKCNLLEDPLEDARPPAREHCFPIHRHEIVSIRIFN